MAESAVLNHPVPKPRVSRSLVTPSPSTPTPSQSTPSPDSNGDQVNPVSPDPPLTDPSSLDPPPYSSLISPSPTQHTDSDQSDADTQVVLRKKKSKAKPTLQDGPEEDDYENIDALLDEEVQESIRRSDYINWVCLDSDGEETQDSRGGAESSVRLSHDRYAPSVKLDKHPALKKSQSTSEISMGDSGAALIEAMRKRPRNRAPPPPPGKKDKGQASASPAAASGSGHKRSRSDLSGHSPEPPRSRPPGGQSSNLARAAPTRPVGRLSPGQKRGGAPRPPNQKSPELPRGEPLAVRRQASPKDVKPKRQAPPPPATRRGSGLLERERERGGVPEYASVNKLRKRRDQPPQPPQSDPVTRRQSSGSSGGDSVGPPKPLRTWRTKSIEDLTRHAEEISSPRRSQSHILDSMDLFTLELKKDRDVSFGLVIVTGKVRESGGEGVLEGVFVQKVITNSPADNDGRIQPGDMLVEVGGRGMVGGALEETIQQLRDARESIRLKIARPNVSSSVFTVEGDDEQPIYENDMLPPGEMLLKLHQTEGRLTEVETERDKALTELLAIREQAAKEKAELSVQLEEMRRQLEDGRVESETRTNELAQALASVTVGRSKAEGELEGLRAQVAELRENLKASDKSDELESLRLRNSHLEAELAREREKSARLQEKLDIAESAKESESEEVAKLCEKINVQEDQIASLKADLEQLRNTRAMPLRTAPHVNSDLSPLDQTSIKDIANGDGHHDNDVIDESCGSDDAFDNRVLSPVTPSPYLDFVPFEEKGRKEKKNASSKREVTEITSSNKGGVEEEVDQTVTENGEESVEGETNAVEVDLVAVAKAEFDAVVTSTAPLNSSAALHKSEVSRKLLRKKPSRDHLKIMGSSFDLLEAETEEATPPEPEDTPPKKTVDDPPISKPLPDKPPSVASKKASPTPEQPVTPQPKPRPRPRPRQTISHEEKRPQVTPRHKEVEGSHSREASPLPHTAHDLKKPMVPSPKMSPSHKPPPHHEPTVVSDHTPHSSPLLKKKEPILPSSKPSPKHLPKLPKVPPSPPSKEAKPVEVGGMEVSHPKPLPRQQLSTEEPSVEEREPKITVESPERERAAHHSAPGSPVKSRHPPPVAKKPKHDEEHLLSERESSPRRAQSFDNELDSPRHIKKLPVGAVNLMGFLPVHSRPRHGDEGEARDRSMTVSTSEPGARERNSLKRQIEKHEDAPPLKPPPLHEEDHVTQDEDVNGPNVRKVPPQRPPPPKKSEQVDGVPSSDEVDSDASPMLATRREHSSNGGLEYGEVLLWSPDVVGAWLEKIGLGRHKQVFVERGFQGHALFEMDGHNLKGLGMDSHNERAVFKREVKVLKPFADKQRKAIEKQKKEEKKNAKKKKK